MIEKLEQLKQFVYQRLPTRRGLRSRVQQITSTVSKPYAFKLSGINPTHQELNKIRQIIVLDPYVAPTHPVEIKLIQSENEMTDLSISFTVLNIDQGKKIEALIRTRFPQTESPD